MQVIDLIDKAILLFCCFGIYLGLPAFGQSVVPVILCIFLSGLLSLELEEKIHLALATAFLILCVQFPGLTIFLPLLCYDLFLRRYQLLCLAAFIPIFLLWKSDLPWNALYTIVLSAVSLRMKYGSATRRKQQDRYHELLDTAKQLSLRLKKQNSDLMEQQDSEINLATLNERNRIAREIHDSVGHLLSSALLQVGALLAVNREEKLRQSLQVLNGTLTDAMNSIRTSVHDLYDESVDLYAQVYELTKKFTFCELSFDYELKSEPEKKLKYAFIAIVKEALSNIIRHSDASHVQIVFREHPALYQLIISDNGSVRNFNPKNGIGLKNIADRVEAFHGNLNISTQKGFQLFISVPKGETEF